MKKDEMSYVEVGSFGSFKINNSIWPKCPGNGAWAMKEEPVITIEEITRGPKPLLHWRLIEKYNGIVDLPLTLPKEATPYDRGACDCTPWNEDECKFDPGFFEAVYGDSPEILIPCGFEIVDNDCEPILVPNYVKVLFPACLKEHPRTWSKFPCSIKAEKIWEMVIKAILPIVKSSPFLVILQEHISIGHLVIGEKMSVSFPSKTKERYRPMRNSDKTLTRLVDEHYRVVPILDLVMAGNNYGDINTRIFVDGLEAQDYRSLEKAIEKYVKGFTDILTTEQREVCPYCKGIGAISAKKEGR